MLYKVVLTEAGEDEGAGNDNKGLKCVGVHQSGQATWATHTHTHTHTHTFVTTATQQIATFYSTISALKIFQTTQPQFVAEVLWSRLYTCCIQA